MKAMKVILFDFNYIFLNFFLIYTKVSNRPYHILAVVPKISPTPMRKTSNDILLRRASVDENIEVLRKKSSIYKDIGNVTNLN